MKKFLILILFLNFQAIGQNSYVYKRNLLTGELEVFSSTGGFPTGSPLMKFKRNLYGYLEVQELPVNSDPYTGMPDYSALKMRNPYQLPINEIIETIESLNLSISYQNKRMEGSSVNSNITDDLNNYRKYKDKIATSYLNLINNLENTPKILKNGWYRVARIFKEEGITQIGLMGGNSYSLGIAKVIDNILVEYYENKHIADNVDGFVFQKIPLYAPIQISNLSVPFKNKITQAHEKLYFINNIFDPNIQEPEPNFSFFSIYSSSNTAPALLLFIKRNEKITDENIKTLEGIPYQIQHTYANPIANQCDNSNLTLAFKEGEKNWYSIAGIDFLGKGNFIFPDISISTNNCGSLVLNDNMTISEIQHSKAKSLREIPKKEDISTLENESTKPIDIAVLKQNIEKNLVKVDGGSFKMGARKDDKYAQDSEKPQHTITLSSFYISKYEVTFIDFDAFCDATGRNKPNDKGWGRGKRPVFNITWEEAAEFCKWLSTITGKKYRLPTEAEWEYAAKGGRLSKGYIYSGGNNLIEVGWYKENSGKMTHPVGQLKPNELGIYDMSGNVLEFCNDFMEDDYYNISPSTNPKGPKTGSFKSCRGGYYDNAALNEGYYPYDCRLTDRGRFPLGRGDIGIGFRICREL